MLIDIVSLFPEYFQGPFSQSILRRAIENKLIEIRHTDIRDFTQNKHKKVDDRPFGGGPGMILMAQPVVDAIRSRKTTTSHVIYLSPQGRKLTAAVSVELSKLEHVILLCGHYEGIDERVMKEIDEEMSIGDYVLTNGCAAAIVVVDAVSRFIPGVLGHPDSAFQDSFQEGIFDSPQYTRPEEFEGIKVPEVLRGGNHAEIERWRREESLKKTHVVRPDLYESYNNKRRREVL